MGLYNLCMHSARNGKSYFFTIDKVAGHKGQNEVPN